MKMFLKESNIIEYLNISKEYWNQELTSYLGCVGSEIMVDIPLSEKSFNFEGFFIESQGKKFEICIASIEMHEDNFINIYCIVEE